MLAAYLICLVAGGVFVGLSVVAGLGKDLDGGDAGHFEGAHGAHGGHGQEREHDVAEAAHAGKPRRWLPFTSLRFWTFGAFFFGLTGVALRELAAVAEPAAGLAALGVGVGGGLGAAALVHALRKSVGTPPAREHWTGVSAELLLPLAPGGLSKVRVTTSERERDLVVALADPAGAALPKGTRVVILRLEADGRALVAPEAAMFPERREAREEEEVQS